MNLDEIESFPKFSAGSTSMNRLSPDPYGRWGETEQSANKNLEKIRKAARQLPGSPYLYTVVPQRSNQRPAYYIYVLTPDGEVIGGLDIDDHGKMFEVDKIQVLPKYQGQGLGMSLYGIALSILKKPLVAGTAQTPDSQRAWLRLSQIPGVQVMGLLQMQRAQVPFYKWKVEELGAKPWTRVGNHQLYLFPVTAGKKRMKVAQPKVHKIYGRDTDELYTTMIAFYNQQPVLESVQPTVVQENPSAEISQHEKLDRVLIRLCEMLQAAEHPKFGMVAAAVIDPDNRIVAALNRRLSQDKNLHAEPAAMRAYEKRYGTIPDGSIIVTTLSPCAEPMAERQGQACVERINQSNVHKVYCGYMDHTQHEGLTELREFTLEETANPDIRRLCKKYADTFLDPTYSIDIHGIEQPGQVNSLEALREATLGTLYPPTILGTLQIDDIVIALSKHLYDRAEERKIPLSKIESTIRRLRRVKSKMRQYEPGSKFWVYNPYEEIALGFQVLDSGAFKVNTVIAEPPHAQGELPIVRMYENLTELWTQPYELTSRVTGPANMEYYFDTKDNRSGRIVFDSVLDTDQGGQHAILVIVHFYIDNVYHTSGKGDAVAIFSTVVAACRDYLRRYKPPVVAFETDDPKKRNLYVKMAGMFPDYVIYPYPQWVQDPIVGDEIVNSLMDGNAKDAVVLHRRNYDPEKTRMYIDEQGVAGGLENNRISFQIQKGKNKFATTLSISNNPVGVYQYDADTGRSIAEVYPEFKGKGLGKLLVLHAIYTAAQLGLNFQEDESRTAEYDNVLDSLSSSGYIVDDDGYWYVTGEGEQYLQQSMKQGVAEGSPNFNREWDEATRYPEFVNLGKEKWIELVSKGKPVTVTRKNVNKINNTDAADPKSFKLLDPEKQKRALAQLANGDVEMPIVARYSDGYLELIGGNTRLTAQMAKDGQAKVWLFNVPEELTQGVAEAFDQPYATDLEKSEHDDYDSLVQLPDGSHLSIMFNHQGDAEYQVEFWRGPSQEVTGEGDAQRIFATVLNTIQKFIKEHNPWRLTFSATKDVAPGQNSESRAKLYNRLVDRYAAAWGYDALINDLGDQVEYELTRLKPGIAEGLNFDEIYGKHLKVTDNNGDPRKPGFSLVTPLNGDSWNWRERPEFKDLVKQKLNDPGFLGDHKYQQIIASMSGKQFDPTKHIAKENFADGKVKGKSRPGRVKRAGASCNGSVTDLRRRAKNASGEKAKMYHWCANMKSGRSKNNESQATAAPISPQAWIDQIHDMYPQTWQNNHVMPMGGEGEDQQFAMFELVPSTSKKNAVDIKWFQAYPLRQGVGSRAIKELQQLAREADITLTLYPWDKGRVSQAKLMKFYRGQGFQPTVKGSKNMFWSPEKALESGLMESWQAFRNSK